MNKATYLHLIRFSSLSSVPHPRHRRPPHLLLQQKNPLQQRLRRRRTPRHIDINRHNPIHATHHTITIMIIPTSIRTAAHTNNPFRIGHLIVKLSEGRCHFVAYCARDKHDVGLPWRGAEDYAQTVLVVARHGGVHHFDSAAGQGEGQGPEGALASPVDELVGFCTAGQKDIYKNPREREENVQHVAGIS